MPILIEVTVLVGIGELAVAVVAPAETSETGGITVQEVPILIEVTVLVGIGELAATGGALAKVSETQIMPISDTKRDTMAILKIIDLICCILLKYVISFTFQYLAEC